MEQQHLVGTWKLLSYESRRADGSVHYPFGDAPLGLLMYDALGYMAGQMMKPGRAHFASNDLRQASPGEFEAAAKGYVAYFGRYAVDVKAQTVTHQIIGSLFPNWVGVDQVRFFQLEGQLLTLTTPPVLVDQMLATGVLRWQRL